MKKPKHTPGPWRACNNGKCSCHTVWSVTADAPVCKVEYGEWGDRWPAIRVEPGIGGKAEAYMEFEPYGSIPSEFSTANVHLIATAPEMYEAIAHALEHMERAGWQGMIVAKMRNVLAKAGGENGSY